MSERAYPSPDWNGSWVGPHANHGMTLRDWFAGQALQALACELSKQGAESGDNLETIGKKVAYASYRYADAMMEARKK